MPFAILAGVIIGVSVVYVTPQLLGMATAAYDSVFPVLTMRGELVSRDADYVDVHIRGTKHRGEECRLVSVYAYTVRADGLRADAFANRMDQPQAGRLRGVGEWDIGIWRVRPVDSLASRAEVWTHHNCVGRDVLTRIADVGVR